VYGGVHKLLVWQKAHELVLKVYDITKGFPREEQFGLASQMRRAAVSIPSNIVEGKARGTNKEYKRFLLISRGSLEELKYQLFLSRDLKYLDEMTYVNITELTDEIGKMLNGLVRKLEMSV
jgi:four helix bundle protein